MSNLQKIDTLKEKTTLAIAVVRSPSNKAFAKNETGVEVYVQERYASLTDRWLHVWTIGIVLCDVHETDVLSSRDGLMRMAKLCEIDPDAKIWTSL